MPSAVVPEIFRNERRLRDILKKLKGVSFKFLGVEAYYGIKALGKVIKVSSDF
jgi:hypothetical protein